MYEGNFLNGKFSGRGKYTFYDGKIYEGLWENDLMNGEGSLIFPEGMKINGIYKNGGLVGDVHIELGNGDIYKGEFRM